MNFKKTIIILLLCFSLFKITADSNFSCGTCYSFSSDKNNIKHSAGLYLSYDYLFGDNNVNYGFIINSKISVPFYNNYNNEKGFKYTSFSLSTGFSLLFGLDDYNSFELASLFTYEKDKVNILGLSLINDFKLLFTKTLGLKFGYNLYYPIYYLTSTTRSNKYFEISPLIAFTMQF